MLKNKKIILYARHAFFLPLRRILPLLNSCKLSLHPISRVKYFLIFKNPRNVCYLLFHHVIKSDTCKRLVDATDHSVQSKNISENHLPTNSLISIFIHVPSFYQIIVEGISTTSILHFYVIR